MKSAWKPFTRPVKSSPIVSGALDGAERDYIKAGGIPAGQGVTFTEYARGRGVSAQALRARLISAGALEKGSKAGAAKKTGPEAGTSKPEEKPIVYNPNFHKVTASDCIQSEKSGVEGSNSPIVYNPNFHNSPDSSGPPAVSRGEMTVLSDAEIIRHDAEIAALARESITAFRSGKSKGPKGGRVLPVSKVSDITALDTLFRRATRQGEREAGAGARSLISIQFLGGINRETVRTSRDETSPILDAQGEETDL
jgi:hypothetical protein